MNKSNIISIASTTLILVIIFGLPKLKKAFDSVIIGEELGSIMCKLKSKGYTMPSLSKKAIDLMGKEKMVNTKVYGKLFAYSLENRANECDIDLN